MGLRIMPTDAISVTVRVTRVLEMLGVPYFIGESLASTLYGMVRTTGEPVIRSANVSDGGFA